MKKHKNVAYPGEGKKHSGESHGADETENSNSLLRQRGEKRTYMNTSRSQIKPDPFPPPTFLPTKTPAHIAPCSIRPRSQAKKT